MAEILDISVGMLRSLPDYAVAAHPAAKNTPWTHCGIDSEPGGCGSCGSRLPKMMRRDNPATTGHWKFNMPPAQMKSPLVIPALTLTLFLGGCLPEERIWWSPGGQEAAILVEGGLQLVKANEALGAPLMGGSADKSLTPAALSWLPDQSGFVVCLERKVATWQEASRLLPAAEASRIDLLALAMPTLLEGAGKLASESSDADALLTSVSSGDPDGFLNALLCAYQTRKEAVVKALKKLPKGPEFLEKLNGDGSRFTVYEIALVRLKDGRADGAPQGLAHSLYAMALPRVSPKQAAVAYLQSGKRDMLPSLEVTSLDGSARLTVTVSAMPTFDWSPDGKSIVFASPVRGRGDSLAKIQRSTVVGESGALANSASGARTPDALAAPGDLSMAILLDPPRLQVLPDGNVLFASQAATLPAAGDGPAIDPKLYLASADGKTIAAVPTAPGALPTNLSFFVASPDGKLAAVVESGNDTVAVVDIGSGVAEVISPAHPDWRCRTLPAWKSATELTFAALDSPDGVPKWMLWSKAGGVHSISEQWPAAATGNWLEKEKPKDDEVPVKPPSGGDSAQGQ